MSSTGVFGPPPPGVDLAETQNIQIFSSVIALMIIGTIAVVARIMARRTGNGLGLAFDDYLIFFGLLFAYGTALCCLILVGYGGGKHLWTLNADQFITIWQILFAYVMIYATAVTFTKFSILMFYRRIFGAGIKWSLYVCSFLVIGYWVTICVTILVACRPLPYFWTRYTDPTAKGTCIDVPKFFFGNGIAAMLIDVCILVVPIPVINGLNMPKSQKRAVLAILLLGGFVCVASIVRIVTIETLINSIDLTWAMSGVFIWSCCEPFIGIVCACLPTLAPLFRHWWAAIRTHTANSSGNNTLGSDNHKQGNYSLSKRHWTTITEVEAGSAKTPGGGAQRKLRPDDEVELTNDISGHGDGSVRTDRSGEGITVKHDVRWESRHMDDV